MEMKTRPRGRPRSFDPDTALEAALLLFWEHGYEGTSLARLQEATGLTAPAWYRAFGSKERLFELAVQRYQERYGFGIRDDLPLVAAVGDYLDRAAREFTTLPGRGCLVSTGMLATSPDARFAADVVRAERERAVEMLRERFTHAVTAGELPEGVDANALARTLAALIQGMSVQARDGAGYEQLRLVAQTAERLIPNRA
jgi:AcrR family transcriptional regulator